jgi:hypothetical protein
MCSSTLGSRLRDRRSFPKARHVTAHGGVRPDVTSRQPPEPRRAATRWPIARLARSSAYSCGIGHARHGPAGESRSHRPFLADDRGTGVLAIYTEQGAAFARISRRNPALPRGWQAGDPDVRRTQREVGAGCATAHRRPGRRLRGALYPVVDHVGLVQVGRRRRRSPGSSIAVVRDGLDGCGCCRAIGAARALFRGLGIGEAGNDGFSDCAGTHFGVMLLRGLMWPPIGSEPVGRTRSRWN